MHWLLVKSRMEADTSLYWPVIILLYHCDRAIQCLFLHVNLINGELQLMWCCGVDIEGERLVIGARGRGVARCEQWMFVRFVWCY